MDEPIAVVGIGCRFPDADDPSRLWESVLARRRAFRRLPAQRLDPRGYISSDRSAADTTYVKRAALLEGWTFDRERFRVPGSLYRAVDPAHWLALEVADATLSDAGAPGGEGLDRDRVGVVIGNSLTGDVTRAHGLRTRWPYVRRTVAAALSAEDLTPEQRARMLARLEEDFKRPFPVPGDESLAGALANTIAGRICNHYDFHGFGYTVDGACASSLLAVSNACAALQRGELDLALAGGVDLSLDPFELVGFARLGALAEDEMRIYDRDPTGFLPGEGCGMVALTRLSHAHERGMRVYALIGGWGVSSDGAGGLTRPEQRGQALALDRAYRMAGFSPATVDLFEGHGTGTQVGDAVELDALTATLRRAGRAGAPAVLGSIKANIGHTKAAAGIAGLLKAVLAVHHELLPPTTGCRSPRPELTDNAPVLRTAQDAEPWCGPHRRAGVTSAGFGGINTHVVVSEARPARRTTLTARERRLSMRPPGWEVVALGAADREGLARELRMLAGHAAELSDAEFTDLAVTLTRQALRDRPWRAALVADGPSMLADRLHGALGLVLAGEDAHVGVRDGTFVWGRRPARPGLLLPGQAAPVYPDAGWTGRLVDTGDLFADGPVEAGTTDTTVAQHAIVRSSLAGLRYVAALDVAAVGAVGHSLGELTALCWADALSEREALRLARTRGEAMGQMPGEGGMISLATGPEPARRLIEGTAAVIAACNGPASVTVAGPAQDLETVLARVLEHGVRATRLRVSHPFHTSVMAPAAEELEPHFKAARLRPPRRDVYSSVTGKLITADVDLAALLSEQLTAPVRFADALEGLLAHADLLIEAGPGTMLTGIAEQAGVPVVALDSGNPSARPAAEVTAALFAACGANAGAFVHGRGARHIDASQPRRLLTSPCETTFPAWPEHQGAGEPAKTGTPTRGVPPEAACDARAVVEELLVTELELPAVRPQDRLLTDLHLNSLKVGRLAAEAAARLGRAAPVAPPALAGATVADLAAYVDELPEAGQELDSLIAGVAPWVRAFEHRWVPAPPPGRAAARDWKMSATHHPLADELSVCFPPGEGAPSRLVALPPGDGDAADVLTAALQEAAAENVPIVVLHHQGLGAALGRSLVAERPDTDCLVIDAPATKAGLEQAAEEASRVFHGYTEITVDGRGGRTTPVTRHRRLRRRGDPVRTLPLGPEDVCVVTGGAKGIGAECALALAQATRARIVLLGRSEIDDPEVAANLERFAAAGAKAIYLRTDITDPEAVRHAVRHASKLGPVRGLVHSAGHNRPGRIEAMTPERMRATFAPKVQGLELLLSELDEADLRMLITFGSVIARIGLPGESDYALANERLRLRVADAAARLPRCRCLNIEWSVWSGTGMGARLGAVDMLTRQGVAPIPVPEGVAAFMDLLAENDLPFDVMVCGRHPRGQTLVYEREAVPTWRFLQRPLIHHPGVELITEADLSMPEDLYLDDHVLDGVALLPAVVGMEAMAQAAAAVAGRTDAPAFEHIRFSWPVTVPTDGVCTVRLAALSHDDGQIEVVLRAAETGYAVDHFSAVCRFADRSPVRTLVTGKGPGDAVHDYYGTLFFHGSRFHRLRRYELLTARRCEALVNADLTATWFAGFHDPYLLLGDPGTRDAYIHVLQGCVPGQRVLPVAVESVQSIAFPTGTVRVRARERHHDGATFVYDLDVTDANGTVIETWRGLRLTDTGPMPDTQALSLEMLGPHLARTLDRLFPSITTDLVCVASGTRSSPATTERMVRTLLDGEHAVSHSPEGRLIVSGAYASASHHAGYLMVAIGTRPIAVDWEAVEGAPTQRWDSLLSTSDAQVARQITVTAGEPNTWAAARIWTAREALAKLGAGPSDPLILVPETRDDGWLLMHSGQRRIAGLVTAVRELPSPVAIAVCLQGDRQGSTSLTWDGAS
ncbi:type I polyketide synthase [Actinomadura sp. ATCC 39365]